MRRNLRLRTFGREELRWISICLLAGFISSVTIIVGCRTAESGENSRIPKLTPRPLVIPQIWYDSFDQSLQESAATGKPVLVNFTGSDWCQWCVKLKSDVFDTEPFGTWAKDNVVLLALDYPKRSVQSSEIQRQNQELRTRYQISGFPTVLFLDSQGNLIGKGPGYKADPQAWIDEANAALGKGN